MQDILFLHGALGSKEQFGGIEKALENDFSTHSINFSGHGGEAIPDEKFSIELFAADVLQWMDENKTGKADIFGYSMGGYVALYIARHYPERIGKIFTLATKFDWNEESSAHELKMLDAKKIKEKVSAFAEELIKRHGEDRWELVLKKTGEMMINLGKKNVLKPEDLELIENEVLIGVGDRDKMVTIEESINAYRNLKNGELIVLSNTPHPFELVSMEVLRFEILQFFK